MAVETELAHLLNSAELFSGLDTAERVAIARAMQERKFNAGQMIFSRDDAGSSMYLVLDGRVRLSAISSEGRELTFRFAGRGEMFGEIASLDGGARSADAVAESAVRVAILTRTALWDLIGKQHALAKAIIEWLCRRVRHTSEQLEGIALYSIETRLARFLVAAVRQAGHDADDDEEVALELKMSQREIGLVLGASRPKINVALGALEDRGAIRRKGERIVCRPSELMAMIDGEEI